MQNFHRSMGPVMGIPFMDTAPSDPFSAALGSLFGLPSQLLGAISGVAHDVINRGRIAATIRHGAELVP